MPHPTDQVDALEVVRKALHRAWNLGQDYWRQADSDSYKQNALSDKTREKYEQLATDTLAILAEAASPAPAPAAELDEDQCSQIIDKTYNFFGTPPNERDEGTMRYAIQLTMEALAAAPQQPSPAVPAEGVRMLTHAEVVRLFQNDKHAMASAIQRKFIEVNGLKLEGKNG